MRICHGLLCDAEADVWMRGKPWCIPCSIKRFGIVAAPVAAPGAGPSTVEGLGPGISRWEPAPLSDYDLYRLLEVNGWDLLDAEWACVNALGEFE